MTVKASSPTLISVQQNLRREQDFPRHDISHKDLIPKKYNDITKSESLATKWFPKLAKKTCLSQFDEVHQDE